MFMNTGERDGGMNWESGTGIYTLPCVKQTAGGKLLHNTGSSAQCTVMTGVGMAGEFRREGVHVYNGGIKLQYNQNLTQVCKAIIANGKRNDVHCHVLCNSEVFHYLH